MNADERRFPKETLKACSAMKRGVPRQDPGSGRARILRYAITLLLGAAALAACAELEWDKPGAGPRALAQDLDECRQSARMRAVQEAWPYSLLAPRVVGVDRDGRLIVVQPPPHDTERFLLEQDLTRTCMREKGYELVPVTKPGDEVTERSWQ